MFSVGRRHVPATLEASKASPPEVSELKRQRNPLGNRVEVEVPKQPVRGPWVGVGRKEGSF